MAKNQTQPQSQNTMHPAWEAAKRPMADFSNDEIDKINEKIKTALVSMLLKNEFFGIVALRLGKQLRDDIKSAATDGRNIYFNPGFVNALSLEETVFLIGHEVYHCVFEHFLRRDSRNPMLWNIAGDYVINGICDRDKLGKVIGGALLDRQKYDGMTTEQIYDQLDEEMAKHLETLDDHFDISDMGDADGDGDGKGSGKTISSEEAKQIQDEIRASVIQAAKAAGNVPGEIKRIVDGFLKPKIDWRDLLAAQVASKVPYDTTFTNPNRRSWSNQFGAIFPGDMPDQKLKIAIALDNSGSFTDEMLKEAMSEVYGIMSQYTDFDITIWCFDTQVSGEKHFTPDNIDEITQYEFTGGGGTAIAVNWDYMQDKEIEVDMFVCFTDLYSGDLQRIDPSFVDTVWIVHSSREIPPFGQYAYYEDAKKR